MGMGHSASHPAGTQTTTHWTSVSYVHVAWTSMTLRMGVGYASHVMTSTQHKLSLVAGHAGQ
jgi:hypothetical protein